jgi:hypothetical protein
MLWFLFSIFAPWFYFCYNCLISYEYQTNIKQKLIKISRKIKKFSIFLQKKINKWIFKIMNEKNKTKIGHEEQNFIWLIFFFYLKTKRIVRIVREKKKLYRFKNWKLQSKYIYKLRYAYTVRWWKIILNFFFSIFVNF